MTEQVGAWERPASILLIDTKSDREKFLPLLQQLEKEHKVIDAIKNYEAARKNIELAYNCLEDIEGRKFLIMFAWDYINQVYLPFSSGLFEDDEVEVIHNIVKEFIATALRCCCIGFDFRNLNEENRLIGFCIQALCENEMMQVEIQRLKELN